MDQQLSAIPILNLAQGDKDKTDQHDAQFSTVRSAHKWHYLPRHLECPTVLPGISEIYTMFQKNI